MFVITATAETTVVANSIEDAAITVWDILQDWGEDYYTLERVNNSIQTAIDENEDWVGWFFGNMAIRCDVKVKVV